MAIGKLTVPGDLRDQILGLGLRVLNLSSGHGLGVACLPLHHSDPFDRLLISQALAENLAIVTADRRFRAYPVEVVGAAD